MACWIGADKESLGVGIVGLGYVGLPLAIQFAKNGNRVVGFDVDQFKCDAINAGMSYIADVPSSAVNEAVQGGTFKASSQFDEVSGLDAIIICVPTPLTKHREPDISYIIKSAKSIAPFLKPGQLVVLESTTYPGTTDEDLLAVLEEESGLLVSDNFLLAFSPEREDPGNKKFRTGDIPKVVGGFDAASGEAATKLYGKAGIKVVNVSSCRAAEATKLLENIFRCVNIALVNELKVVFDRMDIDIWEVIEAAKTKPFGYMPFYPGPGLGGHCIPIDPFYLTWKAREYGTPTKFIELAGEINTEMPHFVVDKLVDALSRQGKPLKDADIVLFGVAYKKDVEDVRESPSFAVWEMLESREANIYYSDPYVSSIPKEAHTKYTGITSVQPYGHEVSNCDAVVILTDHSNLDYTFLAQICPLIIDTRNACKNVPLDLQHKIIKA